MERHRYIDIGATSEEYESQNPKVEILSRMKEGSIWPSVPRLENLTKNF